MERKIVKFGIIGCGLMGREFASASLRWPHLWGDIPRPVIVAACDMSDKSLEWFKQVPETKYFYHDYHEMLINPEIEAVYCAVPHNLHAQIYSDIIRSRKHLLGEKPFGIDQDAFFEIRKAMEENPHVFVRCTSEFPFYPAVQQMVRWYREGKFGKIIEASFSIKHSSDMDINKPINWKRTLKVNGEYGCMGDLGIHTQHLPFHLGIKINTVYAQLANIIKERPDGKGSMVPCETYDNAILLCEGKNSSGDVFPVRFEMKRMAPGCSNTVEYAIYGMDMSAKFSTDDPNAIHYTLNTGSSQQAWSRLPVGQQTMYPVITGGIFEFGFSDAMLQMYAAYVSELCGYPCDFGCFRPDEAEMSHALLTGALKSYRERKVITI